MKITRTITEADLVSFGNFLLSKEREKMIKLHPCHTKEQKKENLRQVSHADLENWIAKIKNQ